MADRTKGTLYDQALSVASDVFDTDDSGTNADKVCAVALSLTSDASVAFFSGAPGYRKLVERAGGAAADARRTITADLTRFLGSAAGGGFTAAQINQHGYDPHGRGAMNCAEPKVLYYIRQIARSDPGNWVIAPFSKAGTGLAYNPPCLNCRRWVYGQFHRLSHDIAVERAGPGAVVF